MMCEVEESNAVGDPSAQLGTGGVLMLCRTCGKKGDHWTARCPYKDLAAQSEGFITRPALSDGTKSSLDTYNFTYVPPSMKGVEEKSSGAYIPPSMKGVTEKGNGAYIPPSIRKGAERGSGSDMKHRNEENKVHVSNLSEDTRDDDLHDLFSSFGPLSHVWVAIDRRTGTGKGYGNVNFFNKVDAERAIRKLNGYGYDSLILKVEWSTPKLNKM